MIDYYMLLSVLGGMMNTRTQIKEEEEKTNHCTALLPLG